MHKCLLCSNTSSKVSKCYKANVTFHSFPRNELRRKRWIQSLKLTNYSGWQRVCSEHFSSEDFRPGYKHMLWPSAVPKLPKINITVAPTDPRNSSASTENDFNELPQSNQEVEQSNEPSVGSHGDVARNDSGTPRRSSRKIKPVIAPDGFTYQNESPDKKKHFESKSPTLTKCNTPLRDLNTSNFKSNSPMGESRCSVINCNNNNANSNYSFFLYPKDEELKQIWIQNCRSEPNIYSNGLYRVNSKVCGYHFTEDSFINPSKRNRLKKQSIPTLFVDYVVESSIKKKQIEKPITKKIGTKEFQSLSIVIEPTHIKLNEEIHDKMKLLNVLVASKNIHLYCCIPRCKNSIEGEGKNVNVSLFRPAEEVVDDWSSVFGLKLTENSVLCERHFKFQDFKSHSISTKTGELKIKTLITGAMPIIAKSNGGAPKRLRSNANESELKRLRIAANEELSVKKPKTQLIDDSKTISEHVSPKKSEENSDVGPLSGISNQILKQNNEQTDVHPTTPTDDCTSNSSQSSFEQVLPKILANSSLSIILQSDMKQNKHVSATDSTKEIDDSTNSKPIIQLNTEPATTLDSDAESNSSQPRIDQLLSKSQGNFLSLTLEPNTKHTKQISEINSNEVIDSTSAFKTEPNDENIIPTTSTNNFISEYTAPIIEQSSEIDATKELNPIEIIKIEPTYDDEDLIPVISTDDSSQLINDHISSNISFHKSVSIASIKENKQISPVKVNEIVDPTTISKPMTELNTETTNILPNSNMINTLKSNFDQILSNNSINSLSDVIKPSFNHSIPTTSANNYTNNTLQPNFNSSELKSAMYTVPNQPFTNNIKYPSFNNNQLLETITSNCDQHINQNNGSPFIVECVSLSSSESSLSYDYNFDEELNYNTNNTKNKETGTNTEDFIQMDVGFIRDISKKAALPSNFWKNLYSMRQNTTIFIQQDEFLVPMKKIYFENSLIPEIHINGKRYNYQEAVTSQLELENLLKKIDNIEVCLGYDGQFHENCIGYFEDVSDEEIEVCCNCRKLIKDSENFSQNKLQKIEFLKNKLSKMEYRVIKARKLMQQNKKKEEITDIIKALNPMNFFSLMKHPNY